MDICKEYKRATETRDKGWWCRPWNAAEEKDLKHIKNPRCDTMKWRIGWAKTLRACAGTEILEFLRSISDISWECGKKKGAKHALCREYNRTDEESFPDYRVISFRHAAWLLGWFEGFEEKCKKPGNPRNGTKNGKAAVEAYRRILVHCNWIDDANVKKLLKLGCIPSE